MAHGDGIYIHTLYNSTVVGLCTKSESTTKRSVSDEGQDML